MIPWAGQLISRSGYDKDAQWSFFDIGPWGSGHQHNDKLNITLAAYGRDLLVDCGRFAYRGEVATKFRKYATGSFGHNILLIDGKGQGPGPLEVNEPVPENQYKITQAFDVAGSSFSNFGDIAGTCRHNRTMYYLRGNFWVVVDRITTDRPRDITALWHWHPDCKVQAEGMNVVTANERGNLQIIPAGNVKWKVDIVKGQENPIQGWYSREYNSYTQCPAAVCSARVSSDATMVWVLFPSEKVVPVVSAEIVSETAKEIKIRVSGPKGGLWQIAVPLQEN
jgi:hypothetical protein